MPGTTLHDSTVRTGTSPRNSHHAVSGVRAPLPIRSTTRNPTTCHAALDIAMRGRTSTALR
jgi:hypothetical protein